MKLRTFELAPAQRPDLETSPDAAYWSGYAAGLRDGKVIAIGAIVETVNPDNGIALASRELTREIGERR